MTHPRKIALALALLAGLAGGTAAAGVVLELEEREPSSGAVVGRIVYRLEAGRLRIETRGEDDEEAIVIFRAEKPVAWIVRAAEGTYYEFTPERVAALREKMEEAEKRMAAELAKMPPAQRSAFEEMMERLGHPMGEPEPVSVEVGGRGETVGEWACTRYRILRGQELEAELWTAPPEQAQLRREEFETLGALERLLAPLGAEGPVRPLGSVGAQRPGEKVEGLPVRSLTYSEGEAYREEILVRVTRQDLDARLFELPPGLRRAELEETLEEP